MRPNKHIKKELLNEVDRFQKKNLKAKIISFGQKLQKKITLQFRIKRKLEFQKTNGKKIP